MPQSLQFRVVYTSLGNSHIGKKLNKFMEGANLEDQSFPFSIKSNKRSVGGEIQILEYKWELEKGHTLLKDASYDFIIEDNILSIRILDLQFP